METSDKDALWSRLLGLPPDLRSTSLLTGAGLDEVERSLDLRPDDVLLDLACGRGGYGLELARRAGCRLVGVDFAPPAIEQARTTASRLGLAERSDFRVGDMAATGVGTASVTAALCVDAAQFGRPFEATFREVARVLTPGGRAVFTGWQAAGADDGSVPERLRVDHVAAMTAAGFREVTLVRRPDWQEAEHDVWRRVLEVEPHGDPALLDLQEEAKEVLARRGDLLDRIMVTGRRAVG
jgi:SAM-dependent methyltransferase